MTPHSIHEVAGLFAGGVLLMLCSSGVWANECGAPAVHGTDLSVSGADPSMTRIDSSSVAGTSHRQHRDVPPIRPSDLLGIRHGDGVRIVCKRIDGVDTQVEYNFRLEDIWPVETSDGKVLISAWENDPSQNVVRSARIELDLSQRAKAAATDERPTRRANAARCRKTATGRCSSIVDVRSSVHSSGNRFKVEQETYVNGIRTEWVVWLLER